MVKSKYR